MKRVIVLILVLLGAVAVRAEDGNGKVTLPLEEYRALLQRSVVSTPAPRTAPAQYAIGSAAITADAHEQEGKVTAQVSAEVRVRVLENQWTLVPLLPPGVSVKSAVSGGKAVDLLSDPAGLGWSTQTAGDYTLTLQYDVDARFSPSGYLLAVPVPAAASITLTGTLPAPGLQPSVVPASGSTTETVDGRTRVVATVPTTQSVTLAWAVDTSREVAITEARYTGQLEKGALAITAELTAEVTGAAAVRLPLLPSTVTLRALRIDNAPAKALVEKEFFTAALQGRGTHRLSVDFQVPVEEENGPAQAAFPILSAPISKVELGLPGRKELSIEPQTSITYTYKDTGTQAMAFLPMTDEVRLSWSDAVPEVATEELQAHATVYHLVHAEEGLLRVVAVGQYDINRGAANVLRMTVPKGVELSRVESTSGAIIDWRLTPGAADAPDMLELFLNRQVKGIFPFELEYDLPLKSTEPGAPVAVPLVAPREVSRARGMVAVLQSRELGLKPVEDSGLTKVGENQLPPTVRERTPLTVGHSYKYGEGSPLLTVQVTAPERRQGKFDALVSTLSSLSDVALRGTATVEVNVKSGAVEDLVLELPAGINVLNLTAPSLRSWKSEQKEGRQEIPVQFTQELDGQFRIEVLYEQILGERVPELSIPAISVQGADVEQGRIALEALSAVEVQPLAVQGLSSIDTAELPKQLILKTTNPILLAYKYVRLDPAVELRVRLTRHREVDVQSAVIDSASYSTLVTEDGVAITTADFQVRNAREQFLRVVLPPDSEIWSAFVNGEAQKPALAQGEDGKTKSEEGSAYLVKIINSTTGFPVRLTYKTMAPAFGWAGRVRLSLPVPQMVVTRSRWQLFLPDDGRWYSEPDSNMRREAPTFVAEDFAQRSMGAADSPAAGALPLPVELPKQGVRLQFDKLYANQTAEESYVTLWYGATWLYRGLLGAVALAAVIFWLSLLPFRGLELPGTARRRRLAAIPCLLFVVFAARWIDGALPVTAIVSALALAGGAWQLRPSRQRAETVGPLPEGL